MKKIFVLIVVVLFCVKGKSQDIHFSQFNAVPLIINPALTGVFNGDQRAALNYKDQWTGFGAGYKTYSFSLDAGIMKKKWQNACLGLGLNVFNDVAGDAQMSTTKALLSVSGIININSQQQITAGIQGGLVQNSIDPTSLIWDDQYQNGAYDPGITSMDYVNMDPFYYGDVSAGISWNFTTDQSTMSSYDATRVEAGVSIHHANRPNLHFTTNTNTNQLYGKIIFHANSNIGISNTRLSIKPGMMVALQGPSTEILAGAILRYRTKESSHFTGYFAEQAISIGGYYRLNDAFIPSVWFEMGSFALGVSYDMNVSQLRAASNMRGGMEISLRFINPNPFTYQRWSKPSFN